MNKTIPEGAATSVFCCISPDVKGNYLLNCSRVVNADIIMFIDVRFFFPT